MVDLDPCGAGNTHQIEQSAVAGGNFANFSCQLLIVSTMPERRTFGRHIAETVFIMLILVVLACTAVLADSVR